MNQRQVSLELCVLPYGTFEVVTIYPKLTEQISAEVALFAGTINPLSFVLKALQCSDFYSAAVQWHSACDLDCEAAIGHGEYLWVAENGSGTLGPLFLCISGNDNVRHSTTHSPMAPPTTQCAKYSTIAVMATPLMCTTSKPNFPLQPELRCHREKLTSVIEV